MLFERFEDVDLSQMSYVVGCPADGRVAVVDPRRDVDLYLSFARQHDLRIAYVLETHIHADFASGARELAAATGAELMLSAYDAGELYDVSFPHTELRDGDTFNLGVVGFRALHTPGHTPEHMAFLVFDGARSSEVPQLFLSGDFVFVGSVGRPDLLGEEAKIGLANQLYESITNVLPGLPDGIEVHPGHGSGSMCGAGISGRPLSTLGYERLANPYLQPMQRDQFVTKVLDEVPLFPNYYRRMKQLNADGPASLLDSPPVPAMGACRFAELRDQGHAVVDLRTKEAFAAGHVPGSYFVGHRPGMWAALTVPYDTPLLLMVDDAGHANDAWYRGLVRVGLDDVRGYLEGGVDAWSASAFPVAATAQIEPDVLAAKLADGGVAVLDVRGEAVWGAGHINQAANIPAGRVARRLDEVPNGNAPVAVVCSTGFQSTVVASLLERHGRSGVLNVDGGMAAWNQAGLPTQAAG